MVVSKPWKAPEPTAEDKLLAAFAVSAKALENLDADERRRMIKALIELFGIKGI